MSEFKITISRRSDRKIIIQIRDEVSRIKFFDATMTLEDFAEALTGMGEVTMKGEVRGLQYVGKVKESVRRVAEYTGPSTYDYKKQEEWLKRNCQEEGWLLDSYLGSQGSVYREGDKTYLRYGVYRFVDPTPETAEKEDKG